MSYISQSPASRAREAADFSAAFATALRDAGPLGELQRELEDSPRLRSIARDYAGVPGHCCPVLVVAGDDEPTLLGSRADSRQWRNGAASGTLSWPSTRRVEVGVEWWVARVCDFRRPVTGRRVSPTRRARELAEAAIRAGDLDAWGPQGADDARQIARPVAIYAAIGEGLLISHQGAHGVAWWADYTVVQVVVTDTTTGLRHQITVPPHFARPLAAGERPCDRVRAAIAWTFGLQAEQYHPQVCA